MRKRQETARVCKGFFCKNIVYIVPFVLNVNLVVDCVV